MLSFLKHLTARLPAGLQRRLRDRYRAQRDRLKLLRAALRDARLYAGESGLCARPDPEVLKTRILKSYHRIEKGLALAHPRPGFGVDAVMLLVEDLHSYLDTHGGDWVTEAAVQTLLAYQAFNARHQHEAPALSSSIDRVVARHAGQAAASGLAEGGVRAVTRSDVQRASALPFGDFAASRFSVRQFAPGPVAPAMIEQAVSQARYAPSVCNRQACRVYAVPQGARAGALLALQNGNRGFGGDASVILLVTARLAAFHTVGERYQAWIDGGLFSMSLLYALHAQGLGTCCLNWSVEPDTDDRLHAAAGLPRDELVVMLIAVGHLPEQFEIARSQRRPLEEVLTWL